METALKKSRSNLYTHVFWDFNGTLFDDVDACIYCANRLLTEHGLPILASKEAYRSTFGFPIRDYYKRMGFDFQKVSYDDLAVEWVGYYLEASAASRVYPSAFEALSSIQESGIPQWVLSATEREMLLRQLKQLKLSSYFNGVLGTDTIHAHGKESVALAWRSENPDARVLMVGDTDHDAHVAELIGADCVLVTIGHQDRTRLEACKCLFVAEDLTDVSSFLKTSNR